MSAGSPWSGLHVLVDDDPRWTRDPVTQAREACAGGAHVIQLRAKHASDSVVLAWAQAIRRLCTESGARFVVNDRFDLALCAEADAVHLGQEDLPPTAIPGRFRERLAVGRSTHTEAELLTACQEPLDYVAIGPVFGTRSKEIGYDAPGVLGVARAARAVAPWPLVAIGGIDADNLKSVIAAGAVGVAVIGAVAGAADPVAATRSLVECFA